MPRGVTRRAFLRRAALTTAGTMFATNAIGRVAGSPSFDWLAAPGLPASHTDVLRGIPTPAIVTRARWGADESLRRDTPVFHPPRKIVVHHTAMAVTDDSAADMREVYRQHLLRDGGTWSDVGYHFLVDRHGTVFEGRWARDYERDRLHDGHDVFDRVVRGAHAEGANRGTIGIALLGNFDGAVPTSAMTGALVDLIVWLSTRHGLDVEGAEPFVDDRGALRTLPTIVGHRDVKSTACPGAVVYGMLPDVRRSVAERVTARSYETGGYRIVHTDGTVTARGPLAAALDGGVHAASPVAMVGGAAAGAGGMWVADAIGGVHTIGDAPFHGSVPHLRSEGASIGATEAAAIAASSGGGGYWVLDRDGGVFTFGDATFHGSGPSAGYRGAPAMALAAAPDGAGYSVLCDDGAVLAFGSATFCGHGPARAARDLVVVPGAEES